VVSWRIVYTAAAVRYTRKLAKAALKARARELLGVLARNPYQRPPAFEILVGDLSGAYSRRINIHSRLVDQIVDRSKVVKVLRMWTHYE
jgi:Txe/YoeB family toxin of toxin-antitoxin system